MSDIYLRKFPYPYNWIYSNIKFTVEKRELTDFIKIEDIKDVKGSNAVIESKLAGITFCASSRKDVKVMYRDRLLNCSYKVYNDQKMIYFPGRKI